MAKARSRWVCLSGQPRSTINMDWVTSVQFLGRPEVAPQDLRAYVHIAEPESAAHGLGTAPESVLEMEPADAWTVWQWFEGQGYPDGASPEIAPLKSLE